MSGEGVTMEGITSERARLHLTDIAGPVVANVSHRDVDRLTVVKALPFLRLRSPVRDDEGRTAHIEAVRVAVEDGTPSLVLELVYEASDPRDTLPGFVPDMEAEHAPRRRDETVPYLFERPPVQRQIIVTDPPSRLVRLAARTRVRLAIAARLAAGLAAAMIRLGRRLWVWGRAAREGGPPIVASSSIAHARH